MVRHVKNTSRDNADMKRKADVLARDLCGDMLALGSAPGAPSNRPEAPMSDAPPGHAAYNAVKESAAHGGSLPLYTPTSFPSHGAYLLNASSR